MDTKPTHQLEEKFEMRFFQSNLDEKDDNRTRYPQHGRKDSSEKEWGRSREWASQKVIINFIHSSK